MKTLDRRVGRLEGRHPQPSFLESLPHADKVAHLAAVRRLMAGDPTAVAVFEPWGGIGEYAKAAGVRTSEPEKGEALKLTAHSNPHSYPHNYPHSNRDNNSPGNPPKNRRGNRSPLARDDIHE